MSVNHKKDDQNAVLSALQKIQDDLAAIKATSESTAAAVDEIKAANDPDVVADRVLTALSGDNQIKAAKDGTKVG